MRTLFAFACLLAAACASVPDGDGSRPIAPGKRIALTYDDAPRGDGPAYTGAERTAAFLDGLARAQVGPAAMFVTTRGMDAGDGAARIRAYAAAGHLIANHSDTHPWASRTTVPAYLEDIDAAERKLADLPNRRPWFRHPFLDEGGQGGAVAKRDALRAGLAERGLTSGYVTVDTYDWHLEDLWRAAVRDGRAVDEAALRGLYLDMVLDAAAHYDRMALDVLGRRPAQVLLLHENDLAARYVADLAAALRAEGWRIVTADEAYADPIADAAPQTAFSGMGRLAAIARDAGREGPAYFDHWSASRAGIEAETAARGVFGPPAPGD